MTCVSVAPPADGAHGPAERGSQIAALADHDVVQLQPLRRSAKLHGKRPGDRFGLDGRLGECALHQEHTRLTVGLQIDSGDQRLVQQKRQYVVPMHPRGRRRIDLDAVPEAEESQGSLPMPDERVEGAQQRLRLY